MVTFFGPDPYSDNTLVRLWELAGISGSLTVKLPAGLKATRAVPVDLRGVPQGPPLKIRNGSFKIDLPAFAPASFVLENKDGRRHAADTVGSLSSTASLERILPRRIIQAEVGLINTPLQRGDWGCRGTLNRFNGFPQIAETVKTVPFCAKPFFTPLKRGVNETWQVHELGCHESSELEPSPFDQ
jgi:hypothetical protein